MVTANDLFVKEAELRYQGREGTPFDAYSDREYTEEYLVETKTKLITEIAVCSCPGLPKPFWPHPSDLAALCVSLRARLKEEDDWVFWVVTAKYSTKMPDGGPRVGATAGNLPNQSTGAQNNPELEPPDIEWDFEVLHRAPPRDLDKKAFLNTAKQPFTPAPSFEYANAVLLITRNELDFNRVTASQYSFAVNKEMFLGAEPGTVQCLPPKAKMMFRGSINYWRVSYRLRFGEMLEDGTLRKWEPVEILDQGMSELKPSASDPDKKVLTQIRGPDGVVLSQPVCLFAGRKATDEQFKFGVAPDYLKFRIRRKLSFTNLLRRGLAGKL